MIRAYTGKLGAYKTASMVEHTREDFSRDLFQVYTAMRSLRFPQAVYWNIEEMERFTDLAVGRILLDEAQLALGSRAWQKTSMDVLSALAQLRKNGLDLYFTTQHMDKVDAQLRQIVSEEVECRRVGPFVLHKYWDVPRGKKPFRWRFVKRPTRAFALYDTLEILGTKLSGAVSGSSALAHARARRARSGETGRALGPGETPYDGGLWRVWDGKRFIMTEEARRAYSWLQSRGLLPIGAFNWQQRVRAEIARRRWLAEFGLSADEVPVTCNWHNPWLHGYAPYPTTAVPEAQPQEVPMPPDLLAVKGGMDRARSVLPLTANQSGGGRSKAVGPRRLVPAEV